MLATGEWIALGLFLISEEVAIRFTQVPPTSVVASVRAAQGGSCECALRARWGPSSVLWHSGQPQTSFGGHAVLGRESGQYRPPAPIREAGRVQPGLQPTVVT